MARVLGRGQDFQARRSVVVAQVGRHEYGRLELLAHVEFLLALEAEFDVRLAPRDVMTVVCLGDAVRVLEARLAEARPQLGAA